VVFIASKIVLILATNKKEEITNENMFDVRKSDEILLITAVTYKQTTLKSVDFVNYELK